MPYTPDLHRADREGQREGDLVQGRHRPGRVQEGGQGREELRDRGAHLRQHRRAVAAARGQRRHGERQAARGPLAAGRRCCSPSGRRCCWSGCSSSSSAAPRSRPAAAGCSASSGARSARRAEGGEDTRVNFTDVAGIDEAKDELSEIVDFLKTPEKYAKLGARIPRGVLLSGQPGTGKTLLAKAVAGEAGVPFFSISASEFIEAIVGVGASRVRDLFQQAKDAAPAIIFIDELDAIGRSRSAGGGFSSGGHDEREQTLNQILTEMDGFETGRRRGGAGRHQPARDPGQGAAARRALRPPRRGPAARQGRPPEDPRGAHPLGAAGRRRGPGRRWPQATPGMVGADLANVVNEAALLAAAPRARPRSRQADLTDAIEKIVLGTERKVVQSEEDRRRIAYHEGGHAIVGMLTPGADPVRKVSIIPRGQALGRDPVGAGRRRVQLRGELPARQDQGRAGRPRGRGGRVRHDHHRRRVGHPAGHQDRARDGGALGHERGDRLRGRAARRRRRARCCPARPRDLRGHPAAGRRARCGGSSRRRTTRCATCSSASATSSTRWPRRCCARRRSTRPTPTAPPASTGVAAPA